MQQACHTPTLAPGLNGAGAAHKLGLIAGIEMASEPRWRLPADAQVAVTIVSDDWIPSDWQHAAQQGLKRAFPAVDGPRYALSVYWSYTPESLHASASKRIQSTVLGLGALPGIWPEMLFNTVLLAEDGSLVHATDVSWQPGLAQTDWRSADALEAAFHALGQSYLQHR